MRNYPEINTNEREHGLDVLRTVAMIMVIMMHFPMLINFFESDTRGPNYIISVIGKGIGHGGVNCFWLLTGYLLAKRVAFRKKRFF